ncbi:hypothetical protein [Marinicella gelatinilytica]|uniref:hypothetical protein n=1 Tax=Marinicella gelatinilytica TaxID=2996017 RepID=UPI00226092E5|nr:hypothetical protein [Marinicella gelatinilytica]MCX7546187.1 hypothetical protein [Marinicella gelatinilytica]
MNFDDIKQAMDDEPNDLTIPLSIRDIKSSRSAMKKIKNRLIIEVLISMVLIVVLMLNPLWNEMHESAQILYYLTVFNTIMVILGFVLFQIKLIIGLGIYDLTSRQAIELFIIKIKSAIEVGKYFSFGVMATLFIPIIIVYFGSINYPEHYTYNDLYLNIPWWKIALIIAGIIFFSYLGSVINLKILQKIYNKQLQNLENVIRQF